jgi:hypothetical protein
MRKSLRDNFLRISKFPSPPPRRRAAGFGGGACVRCHVRKALWRRPPILAVGLTPRRKPLPPPVSPSSIGLGAARVNRGFRSQASAWFTYDTWAENYGWAENHGPLLAGARSFRRARSIPVARAPRADVPFFRRLGDSMLKGTHRRAAAHALGKDSNTGTGGIGFGSDADDP